MILIRFHCQTVHTSASEKHIHCETNFINSHDVQQFHEYQQIEQYPSPPIIEHIKDHVDSMSLFGTDTQNVWRG